MILVSDATADPEHAFSDFIRVVRRVRVEHGIMFKDLRAGPTFRSVTYGSRLKPRVATLPSPLSSTPPMMNAATNLRRSADLPEIQRPAP
ncbi:MAG: hypothetical protein WKF75_13860 [Singulisphaera sp.]